MPGLADEIPPSPNMFGQMMDPNLLRQLQMLRMASPYFASVQGSQPQTPGPQFDYSTLMQRINALVAMNQQQGAIDDWIKQNWSSGQ